MAQPLSVSSAEYNSHHLHLVIQFSAAIRKKFVFFFSAPQKKFGENEKNVNFSSFHI